MAHAAALYRALTKLENGSIEPTPATAMPNLARAIVAVFTTRDAERRIAVIEKMVTERAAAWAFAS